MKILITGGTGVIGRPAVNRLLERGHTIRLMSRRADRDAAQWERGIEPHQGSVTEPGSVLGAADGCDVVLHIAGIVAEGVASGELTTAEPREAARAIITLSTTLVEPYAEIGRPLPEVIALYQGFSRALVGG